MSIKPHAFVAMPFGRKPGPDGEPVDFNRVYHELIKPALECAGMAAFRADEETQAGDIRVDMFQELLIADLVVVDLSIDNPNVWYELGVRHALRARGVVLISGGRASKAFDVYTDRKLRYGIRDEGPDPDTLQTDLSALVSMITATMESWHGRKISPVYQLIPNLEEPSWRRLRMGSLREFWEAYDEWESRMVEARRQGRVGDMLVLADEAPVSAFRASAWIRAGRALRRVGRYDFALEQLEKGLAIEPLNEDGLREKGVCLQRLAQSGSRTYRLESARSHYRAMLDRNPLDAETWALLGRVEKDAWTAIWELPALSAGERVAEARYEDALLEKAIACYARAFRADPKHYYSGVNALTLMCLYDHLTGRRRYQEEVRMFAGAVHFSADCERRRDAEYWAKATLADLQVLLGDPLSAEEAYKGAVAANNNNWFALDSSLEQLKMLQSLGFEPDNVEAAIAVVERAIARLPLPGREWEPARVFLFSGHMTDAPDRQTARFSEDMVPAATERIDRLLRELGAGPDDLALTQGACGGDVIFSEVCARLDMHIQWLQPFAEPEFIKRSVVCRSESWRPRYMAVRQHIAQPILAAPAVLGDPPRHTDRGYAYERCNRWLLYSALAWGVDKVHFVCLWNGERGDGPGGTSHMYEEVETRTGQVHWVDTREL